MASSKFSYQKLKKLPSTNLNDQEEEGEEEEEGRINYVAHVRKRNWLIRLKKRRPRVRILRSIGRLVRRKARVMLRNAVKKVVKRLKEGRPYIGEIFAGNYMFLQVNPSSPGGASTTFKPYLAGGGAHFYGAAMGFHHH